jgi:signal peptidase II
MAKAVQEDRVIRFWGPLSALGFALAALAFAVDQASKWWILSVIKLHDVGQIVLAPFFSLTMAWNEGISYSLFATQSQWALVLLSLVLCGLLIVWLAKAARPLQAACFGLIIGGALGNALDRLMHGAVVDFLHFHWGNWSWYIFNVADVAIVAGVALLLYDSLTDRDAKEARG